jgi:DNA-binding XRE family transcriptional regulator
MKITINLPIPAMRALRKVGQDISDSRRRRRITMELMAERAGISRTTIGKIEKGDPTVSMGSYASVFFVLGMINQLSDLMGSAHDIVGRRLQDEKLPKRVRHPRQKNQEAK